MDQSDLHMIAEGLERILVASPLAAIDAAAEDEAGDAIVLEPEPLGVGQGFE